MCLRARVGKQKVALQTIGKEPDLRALSLGARQGISINPNTQSVPVEQKKKRRKRKKERQRKGGNECIFFLSICLSLSFPQ